MFVGWYGDADSFASLRAANQAAERVGVAVAQNTPAGLIVEPNGTLADPDRGVFAGISVSRQVEAGEIAEIVPNGVVELDDWSAATGLEKLIPESAYFLGIGGTIQTSPPAATYLIRVGEAVTETSLNVHFPLKIKLE